MRVCSRTVFDRVHPLRFRTRSAAVFFGLLFFFGSALWAGTEANPCAPSVSPRRFWIPQYGHGDFQGLLFSTLTRIINLNEDAKTATLITCDDSGQPLAMIRQDNGPQGVTAVSQLEIEIEGRGVANIPSFTPGDQGRVGYALIDPMGSALGVEVLFDIEDDTGFLTSTNVRVGILLAAGGFFIEDARQAASAFVDLSPGVNTGFAMLLPRDNDDPVPDVTVDLLFVDSEGQVQGTGQQVLKEGQKVARFASEFVADPQGGPAGLQQPFSGSVEVLLSGEPCDPDSTSNPEIPCFIAFLPLRQEGLVLTTQNVFFPRLDLPEIPQGQSAGKQIQKVTKQAPRTGSANPCRGPVSVQPEPEGSYDRAFFIPQFGHGTIPSADPDQTLEFDTVVKFINFNAEEVGEDVYEAREIDFEIVTCSEDGQPLNMLAAQDGPQGVTSVSSLAMTLPPNGTREVSSLNANPGSQIDVGYGIVRSGFINVEVIFNIRRGDGFFTSTNVPLLPVLTATSFFADIDSATPLNTGIAFLFPWEFDLRDPEPGVVRSVIDVFLLNEQGEIVAETDFTLDRGHKTDDFLFQLFEDQLGDILQPFTGSIEIRASRPTAFLPLRQEGLVLTTQALFPPRVLREILPAARASER